MFWDAYMCIRLGRENAGSDNGIDIRYCSDGSVFNPKKLQAKTNVKTDIVNQFLFADDCTLDAATKTNMQNNVDKLSMACANFGRTNSLKKTEVMHQPASGKPYVELNIIIKRQRLKMVEQFTYFSSTILVYRHGWRAEHFSSQHLHHVDAITASLVRSNCLHERSLPPEETTLQWTVSRQALPRRQEKPIQRHTEGLHEIF